MPSCRKALKIVEASSKGIIDEIKSNDSTLETELETPFVFYSAPKHLNKGGRW